MEILKTRSTHLGNGVYGCRIYDNRTGNWIVEMRVPKNMISNAIYDMLRTLDKIGYPSQMSSAARSRGKGRCLNVKTIWNDQNV